MFNTPLTLTQITDAVNAFFSIGAASTLLVVDVGVLGALVIFSALRVVIGRK